jgi:hypothetical protein
MSNGSNASETPDTATGTSDIGSDTKPLTPPPPPPGSEVDDALDRIEKKENLGGVSGAKY